MDSLHEVSEAAVNELIIYQGKSRMTLQRREKLSSAAKETLHKRYPSYSEQRIHEEWVDFVMKGKSTKLAAEADGEGSAHADETSTKTDL
jgi:hypothetical protein